MCGMVCICLVWLESLVHPEHGNNGSPVALEDDVFFCMECSSDSCFLAIRYATPLLYALKVMAQSGEMTG